MGDVLPHSNWSILYGSGLGFGQTHQQTPLHGALGHLTNTFESTPNLFSLDNGDTILYNPSKVS